MKVHVARTVSEVANGSAERRGLKSLKDYEDSTAYVLLGAPGSGKTTEFKKEGERQEIAEYVTARDFTKLRVREEWKGKTLFIDGLDEMRAHSATDPRQPLDQIRAKLDLLGGPPFRISCREADWLGANDENALKSMLRVEGLPLLRLNPLTQKDISAIAKERNAPNFWMEAYERGLSTLLENPLTLNLLLDVRKKNDWPDTLTETFQRGCVQLSKEFNIEHQVGSVSAISTDDLLNEAGRLCAVILLAGLEGFSKAGATPHEDAPSLIQLTGPNQDILRSVLRTRLFQIEGDVARPQHRQIAEYLAARYLAKRIEDGMSPRRALAVLTDNDSRVAAPLRGLAAWLAAVCPGLRLSLVERDPIGVVTYGDVRAFSVSEKQKLLSCLERLSEHNPWTLAGAAGDARWGGIATSDMETTLQGYLLDAERVESRQWLTYPLLDALQYGQCLRSLLPPMLCILRRDRYPLDLKKKAFEVCRRHMPSSEAALEFRKLLDDVVSNPKLPDRESLADLLLKELYPKSLPASELPRYFVRWETAQRTILQGSFWKRHVHEHSTDEQLAEILNGFVAYGNQINATPRAENSYLSSVVQVFAKILVVLQGRVGFADPDLIFSWLEFVVSPITLQEDRNLKVFMRQLCRDGDACKAFVERRVAKYLGSDSRTLPLWMLSKFDLPQEFATWCLDKAITATGRREKKFYLRFGYRLRASDPGGEDAFMRAAREKLKVHSSLLHEWLEIERAAEQESLESNTQARFWEQEYAGVRQERMERFKQHAASLVDGRGSASFLDLLAKVYFAELGEAQGPTPGERLLDYLGRDHESVETALEALRGTPRRKDLPTESQIVSLVGTEENFLIAYPYLAGLELGLSIDDPAPDWFSEKEIRRALAFHLGTLPLDGQDKRPAWYRSLLKSRPQVVADAFERVARRFFRSRQVDFPQLYDLAKDDHVEVASLVILPLLRAFPSRIQYDKLHVLLRLMELAIRLVDRPAVLSLVKSKLALRSLMPSQRVYWVCMGLVLESDAFLDPLRCLFMGRGGERLLRHLSEFIFEFEPLKKGNSQGLLAPEAIELLIRLLGPGYRENSHEIQSLDPRPILHGSVVVNSLISSLTASPDPAAGNSLRTLAEEENLGHLRKRLRFHVESHRRSFPTSGFEHPEVKDVLEFLQGRGPVNVPDLMAITVDRIDQLAERIQNGENSDWRQYWDGVSRGSDKADRKPLDENSSRDRFLSDLQLLLPGGVRADGEARHQGDTQSDIRVSFGELEFPLEFKKSHSRDLWSGIHEQLIPRYTKSPSAKGHGMFMVFWFGKEYCKASPEGVKPESAEELQRQLEATLAPDQAHKILVRVIDVFGPLP